MSAVSIGSMPKSLWDHNIQRSQHEEEAVIAAIKILTASGKQISFSAVAKYSAISRSTLYRNDALRSLVEEARSAQAAKGVSEEEDLAAMQRQIEILQEQVSQLSKKLNSLDSEESENLSVQCEHTAYSIMSFKAA